MTRPVRGARVAATAVSVLTLACRADAPRERAAVPAEDSAFAAASGVTRADSGADARAPRVVPLHAMTGDVEILYGDPEKAGPFVMRIHELPGAKVPPHSHPVDENITVVQGTWYFGTGDSWNRSALRALPTGAYAFAPKGTPMFGYSPDGAIVQVHGVGPFHIRWHGGLKTLDDADAASVFALRKGQRVEAPRGRGVIRQGYASGAIVQYEIEADGGGRFMADAPEVRRI